MMIRKILNQSQMFNVSGLIKNSLVKPLQSNIGSNLNINWIRKVSFNNNTSYLSKKFSHIGIYTISSLLALYIINTNS